MLLLLVYGSLCSLPVNVGAEDKGKNDATDSTNKGESAVTAQEEGTEGKGANGEVADEYVFDLGEVVVSATRTKRILKDAPGTVTVVTRKQIDGKATNFADPGDAINAQTGVRVTRRVGHGSLSGVRIRGLPPNKVLVLVDGRPINEVSRGQADLSWLSADAVERIEIVRGPMSALHGGHAVGGVVNIITRGAPEEMTTKLSSAFGTHYTWVNNFLHGATIGPVGYLVQGSHSKTKGYRGANNEDWRRSIRTLVSYDFDAAKVTVEADHVRSRTEWPGVRPPESQKNWLSRWGTATWDPAFSTSHVSRTTDHGTSSRYGYSAKVEADAWELQAWRKEWESTNFQAWNASGNVFTEYARWLDWDNYGVDGKYTLNIIQRNEITVGGGVQRQKFEYLQLAGPPGGGAARTSFSRHRTTWSGFVQDEVDLEPVTLTLGVRRDAPSDFHARTTLRGTALWDIGEKTRVRAGYGQFYRPPTINDMFWPGSENRNLSPEEGWSVEAGVEQEFGEVWLSRLTYFQQKISDMIVWAPSPTPAMPSRWAPSNVNNARFRGIEFENQVQLRENMTASAGVTFFLKREERVTTSYTPRVVESRTAEKVPEYKVDLGFTWQDLLGLEGLRLTTDAQYVSERLRWQTRTQTKRLSGYFLLNARLAQTFDLGFSELEVFVAGNNLLDREYDSAFGSNAFDRDWPAPGLTVLLGASMKF